MALNWNLARINNNDSLCWIPSRKKQGERTMNPATYCLIWATIPVGMNEITAKNVDEFIERLEMLRMLDAAEYGAVLGRDVMADYPEPRVVRAHIGLHTNAANVTKAKWRTKTGTELARVAKKRVAHADAANA